MIKLKNLLKEGSGFYKVDPGPKRWFKPYGDKYTEYEKATNKSLKEAKGNNMYDDVLTLKRSFDIFKQQSPDLYRELDAKFKVKNIQKTLDDMIKFMDTPAAMREATLPKFKTPYEAFSWIMGKREEAMDIEMMMMDISKEIKQLYGEMEQEAEAGGGPITDRYGKELEALEIRHKDLRTEFEKVMEEIDEYDQNY
tara:strand:- start:33 stop:620 length:588 start_codon:yes stop_codon:yes gene_type:complete